MKYVRALILTFWIYSTLLWIYCVSRIIVNNIDPWDPFIKGLLITFLEVGIATFLMSAAGCFLYLVQPNTQSR